MCKVELTLYFQLCSFWQERQILDQLCAPLQRRVLQCIGRSMAKELPLLQVRNKRSSFIQVARLFPFKGVIKIQYGNLERN